MANLLDDPTQWSGGYWDGSSYALGIESSSTFQMASSGVDDLATHVAGTITLGDNDPWNGGDVWLMITTRDGPIIHVPLAAGVPTDFHAVIEDSYCTISLVNQSGSSEVSFYSLSGSITPAASPVSYESDVFVYTMNRAGAVGAWSIYDFPFPIDGFTHLDGGLYIRSGDDVLRVQPGELNDYAGDPRSVPFSATVEWPWLDFGQPGVMKRLAGFDIVGEGVATIEVGYNQATPAFTNPFDVGPDTVPGMIIPLPIMAPSMSVRVTYQGGQKWELYAMNLYLQDGRLTA